MSKGHESARNNRVFFFERAFLQGMGVGRANPFFRIANILTKSGALKQAEGGISQATRGQVRSLLP